MDRCVCGAALNTLELDIGGIMSAKATGDLSLGVLVALVVIFLGYKLLAGRRGG
jgi:hypothetical protein